MRLITPSDPFLDRGLPSAIDAERSILGAILLDNAVCDEAAELLQRQDFFLDSHRRLFEKMVLLRDQQKVIDLVTLSEELRRASEFEQVGGYTYISSLIDGVPRTDTIKHYAGIVKAKAMRRSFITAANRIIADAFDEEGDDSEFIAGAEAAIFDITQRREVHTFESSAQIMGRTLRGIEAAAARGTCGLQTGFTDLDYILGGLEPQNQIIVAARPSMGKTSMGLCIARNIAKAGSCVGFLSSEMSSEQLMKRLLSMESGVDSHKLRTGDMTREEWARINDASHIVSDLPLFIDESSGLNVAQIKSKARRFIAQHKAELLIMDYLGLIKGTTKESRNQEVSEVSRDTKALAKELNIPVIVLCQMNRAAATRTDHRPQLSDLRDSGGIEENADVVIFIHREEYYNPNENNRGQADIIVAKQRNGPTGDVKLGFISKVTEFVNSWSA